MAVKLRTDKNYLSGDSAIFIIRVNVAGKKKPLSMNDNGFLFIAMFT